MVKSGSEKLQQKKWGKWNEVKNDKHEAKQQGKMNSKVTNKKARRGRENEVKNN